MASIVSSILGHPSAGVALRCCQRLAALWLGMLLPAWVLGEEPAARPLPAAAGRTYALSQPAWKLTIPSTYEPRSDGSVDILVHFHGDPPTVLNNVVFAHLNVVLVTVNYNGLSDKYREPFADPAVFPHLLDEIVAKLRTSVEAGNVVRLDCVAVSSFSAGYGAVREILRQPDGRDTIDAVLLADSLYASLDPDGTPDDAQMVDFKWFAEAAIEGSKTLVVTHSEVPTPTYASTRQTADELLQHLQLVPEAVASQGLGGLRFTRAASKGQFLLWGAAGEAGADHMAHLRYMAEWLDDLPLAKCNALAF